MNKHRVKGYSMSRYGHVAVLFGLLTCCMTTSIAATETLYTNIRGYHYSNEVPERLAPPERLAKAPRSGYWASFGAMLIGADGRIKRLFAQTPAAKALRALDSSTQIIDGNGRTVLPGLIDAHGHVLSLGQRRQRVDLVGTQSIAEAQQRLEAFRDSAPGQGWILGRGWNQVL